MNDKHAYDWDLVTFAQSWPAPQIVETLDYWQSRYPTNGYQPGLLSDTLRDKAYQRMVHNQFNQIEGGNETKILSIARPTRHMYLP